MVVAEGTSEAVTPKVGRAFDLHLGTAQIRAVGVVDNFNWSVYAMLQVGSYLEEARLAGGQDAVNGNTYARFEMSVVTIVRHHIEGHSAVCEQEFVPFDAGEVGLEARYSAALADHGHRHHGRYVSLAGSDVSLGVQAGEGKAPGIVEGREQVEAADGQTVQLIFCNYLLKSLIDTLRTLEILVSELSAIGSSAADCGGGRTVAARSCVNGTVSGGGQSDELLNRNVDESGAQQFTRLLVIDSAAYQPVRRLANNAVTLTFKHPGIDERMDQVRRYMPHRRIILEQIGSDFLDGVRWLPLYL